MRWIRRLTIVLLAIAIVIFGAAIVQDYRTKDETIPEIVLSIDPLEIPCAYSEEQLLEGISASDGKDGDLTSEVIVGNFTRFIEPGVSNLSYFVFDSDAHMATVERKVRFTDYYSPRFHLSAPLTFLPEETTFANMREMFTAEDPLCGDLTEWISYLDTDVMTSTPGSYFISMEVRNSYGDTVSYDFPIHILEENEKNVVISLSEPIVYVPCGSTLDAMAYVSGITDVSGNPLDLSIVRSTSNVDTATPGIYEICYEADTGTGLYGKVWLIVIVEEVR